MTKLKESG